MPKKCLAETASGEGGGPVGSHAPQEPLPTSMSAARLFAASWFEGRSAKLRIRIDPTGISAVKVGCYEGLRGEFVPDSNLRDGLFRGRRSSFWGDFSSAKSVEGALSTTFCRSPSFRRDASGECGRDKGGRSRPPPAPA